MRSTQRQAQDITKKPAGPLSMGKVGMDKMEQLACSSYLGDRGDWASDPVVQEHRLCSALSVEAGSK
jgi:hypothetical protein